MEFDQRLDSLTSIDGRYCPTTRAISQAGFTERQLILTKAKIEISWLMFLLSMETFDTKLFARPEKDYLPLRAGPLGQGSVDDLAAGRACVGGCVKLLDFNGSSLGANALKWEEERSLLARCWVGADKEEFVSRVVEIEKTTKHDTKAVELAIKELLGREPKLEFLKELLHIGLTSEDVTGVAYALMCDSVWDQVLNPALTQLLASLAAMAKKYANKPLMGMTHGQPATPITFGLAIAVFLERLTATSHIHTASRNPTAQTSSAQTPSSKKSNSNSHNQEAHEETTTEKRLSIPIASDYQNALKAVVLDHPLTSDKLPELPELKIGGATGTYGALNAAFPGVSWPVACKAFVHGLTDGKFRLSAATTQVPNREWLFKRLQNMQIQNYILLDLCVDFWLYISRGILTQAVDGSSVGSSTMPHKINPINFENAEGNFEIANSHIDFLVRKLSKSRLQRDLSDSTVLRTLVNPFAHTLIAYNSLLRGLENVVFSDEVASAELARNPQVLAEALQTVYRKYPNIKDPYEQLKQLTRPEAGPDEKSGSGSVCSLYNLRRNVDANKSELEPDDYEYLSSLVPETYVGSSAYLVEQVLAKLR